MRTAITILVLVLLAGTIYAEDKVAAQIVQDCQKQIEKAKKAAVDKLKARQEALKKSGDDKTAEEIQAMIDDLEVQGNAKEKLITLTAKASERGISLGNYKKGDKLSFQYVKGEWTPDPDRVNKSSPDDIVAGMKVSLLNNSKAQLWENLVNILPPDTKSTPFVYVFEKDCQKVFLKGNACNLAYITAKANGEVVYKVTIEKQ